MEIKIRFIKVVILIKLVYFSDYDCLSLELTDYNKNICSKIILKTPYNLVCIFYLGCVTSQILQYGAIHDSHLKHIQTTITSLFLGRF